MTHHRSIFISDIHLGTRGCQAEAVTEFLKLNTCDNLYLVGDIVDGWRLNKRWYWPQSHSNVIRRILTHAKRDTKVYYLIGNHDEVLRTFLHFDLSLGRIKIKDDHVHITADGKRYLVIHGDRFDDLMIKNKWMMLVGDNLYQFMIWLNLKMNGIRRLIGLRYWSLSKYLKARTKQAVNFIHGFEDQASQYCERHGYDGLICGHIHTAEIKWLNQIHYINTGDWVESLTYVTEDDQGNFELHHYKHENPTDH